MEHIAFKAHKTRGPEIIKILESWGGVNIKGLDATGETRESVKIVYYVTHYNTIGYNPLSMVKSWGYKIYTLEEYEAMNKEKEKQELLLSIVPVANKGQELMPHKDYEIKQDGEKFYLVKKKKKFPKTYEECLVITPYDKEERILYLLEKFKQLLICRNAYWKIAGEGMGLGKPWEPDWTTDDVKYCLINSGNKICQSYECKVKRTFAFPTKDMQDAFDKNFGPDLDKCKELI